MRMIASLGHGKWRYLLCDQNLCFFQLWIYENAAHFSYRILNHFPNSVSWIRQFPCVVACCNSQEPRSPFSLKIPNSYLLTRQGSHIRVPYDPPFSPLRQVLFRTIGGFQNRLLVKYVLFIIQQQGYQVVLSTFSFRFRSRIQNRKRRNEKKRVRN